MGLGDILVNLLLTMIGATFSSLYEKSSRAKVSKGVVLLGLTLVLLDLLYPLLTHPYMPYLLVIIAFLLICGGLYSVDAFSKFINRVLHDTCICIYAGENCENLLGNRGDNVLKLVLGYAWDLYLGSWSPLEDELRAIKGLKGLRIFLHIMMTYAFAPLSVAFILVALIGVLEREGITALPAQLPILTIGIIILMLGILLAAPTSMGEEAYEEQKREGQDTQRIPLLLPPPTDLYQKILLYLPKSRSMRLLLKMGLVLFKASPSFFRPEVEQPFVVPFSLYECNQLLRDIVNDIKMLEKHGYIVEIYGNPESIYGACKDISGVHKFVELWEGKSPIDIYSEIVLTNKNNIGKHGTKILIKKAEKLGSQRKEEAHRLVAVIAIRAWRGCVGYLKVKPEQKHITLRPRRILSIVIVGQKDVAGLIYAKIAAYLKAAQPENLLCLDGKNLTFNRLV